MKKTLTAAVLALALVAGVMKSAHASYDGTPSTGSFSIVTNSDLAAATASGSVTIVSTTDLSGVTFTIGAYQLRAGRDFVVGASTMAAALSLEAAINAIPGLNVTADYDIGDAEIALTAVSPGTLYNGVALRTSDTDNITVSAATLTGGKNNASVKINGVQLVQGRDWFVADVSSNTALGLAAGINANPILNRIVNAQAVSTTVLLRSVLTPGHYAMSSSAGAPLTASQAAMTGGSQGLLTAGSLQPCFLGTVAALPSSGYPKGCLLYLSTDPTKIYVSTQDVVGTAAAGTNSWLAK